MSDQATANTASFLEETSASTTQEENYDHRSSQHEATTKTAATASEEGSSEDAEGDTEDPTLYPGSIACPCPCHENTAQHEGRPWLAFSNRAYLVCPLCWVDAYMTAYGDEKRLFDCERYLRAHGKDPKVPASKQC
ncbi:hypothetical protein F5Y13DRAFT_184978 [Hypoxylon sp. FL1857]|nr:hypothetical protein F5Y13DRAFT_184978 [Hypoxylon sp. FL1857]